MIRCGRQMKGLGVLTRSRREVLSSFMPRRLSSFSSKVVPFLQQRGNGLLSASSLSLLGLSALYFCEQDNPDDDSIQELYDSLVKPTVHYQKTNVQKEWGFNADKGCLQHNSGKFHTCQLYDVTFNSLSGTGMPEIKQFQQGATTEPGKNLSRLLISPNGEEAIIKFGSAAGLAKEGKKMEVGYFTPSDKGSLGNRTHVISGSDGQPKKTLPPGMGLSKDLKIEEGQIVFSCDFQYNPNRNFDVIDLLQVIKLTPEQWRCFNNNKGDYKDFYVVKLSDCYKHVGMCANQGVGTKFSNDFEAILFRLRQYEQLERRSFIISRLFKGNG